MGATTSRLRAHLAVEADLVLAEPCEVAEEPDHRRARRDLEEHRRGHVGALQRQPSPIGGPARRVEPVDRRDGAAHPPRQVRRGGRRRAGGAARCDRCGPGASRSTSRPTCRATVVAPLKRGASPAVASRRTRPCPRPSRASGSARKNSCTSDGGQALVEVALDRGRARRAGAPRSARAPRRRAASSSSCGTTAPTRPMAPASAARRSRRAVKSR